MAGDRIPSPRGHRAAVLTLGTELTSGIVLDTNTATICAALTDAGFDVRTSMSVPDEPTPAARAISALAEAFDLVVVSGGLGPTGDDITRRAASAALGVPLARDPGLSRALEGLSRAHASPRAIELVMSQADLLEGATPLEATTGSAPGQVLEHDQALLVLLPGPPHEMRPMLDRVIAAWRRGPLAAPVRVGGVRLPEAEAEILVRRALGPFTGVGITTLTRAGRVDIVLRDEGAGASVLSRAADAVSEALGSSLITSSNLSADVIDLAARARATLGTAESCTGGLVAARLTSIPGASKTFVGSIVAYDDSIKTGVLGVPARLIEAHGAVSVEVATRMAEGARRTLGATHAVATTGVAGPEGGTDLKPVGTVCIAIAGPDGCTADLQRFFGDRNAIREAAASDALRSLHATLERSASP
jgi:nicotinamide-nucleotide amidase